MTATVSPHEGRTPPEPPAPIVTYRDWVRAVQERNSEQAPRRKNKRTGY